MIRVAGWAFHEGSRVTVIFEGCEYEVIVESQDEDGTLHFRAPGESDPRGLHVPGMPA